MRAVVREVYGSEDVLEIRDVERPTPGRGELLLRVRGSSLNRADRYWMEGRPAPIRAVTGFLRPNRHRMGLDFAGDVEAIGPGVDDFAPGDAVFGQVEFGEVWGEYARVPADIAAPKPESLDYVEAATLPLSGLTALQGLRDQGGVRPGHSVMINGASGAVGTLAVQIAKALGATVTGICGQRNVELVEALGADHVLAYETDDFVQLETEFDIFFDVAGSRSLSDCRKVMREDGVFVLVGGPDRRYLGPMAPMIAKLAQAPFVSQKVTTFTSKPNRADMETLAAMVDDGSLRPVIDRTYELESIREAVHYLKTGRPGSKVAIAI